MRRQQMALALVVQVSIIAACTAGGPTPSAPPTPSSPAVPSLPPASSPAATLAGGPTAPASTLPPTMGPTFKPYSSPEWVDVVEVTCGTGAPALVPGHVNAAIDGVTFDVAGKPGWVLEVEHAYGTDSWPLAEWSFWRSLPVPPGDVRVRCAPPGATSPLSSALRIDDPKSYFRPAEVQPGAGTCQTLSLAPASGTLGENEDPVILARNRLDGLAPGDVVEAGGYVGIPGLVRVVRAGRVIGRVEFSGGSGGGWVLTGASLCDGLRVVSG